VTRKGQHLARRLHSLADRQPMVTDVRGKGLIWAIELDRPAAEQVVSACLAAGLLANAVKPTTLRFVPPYTVTEAELDRAVEIVEQALAKVSQKK
ncbi:MAG: aminotransferase class III-fold pyridoxal phosphate-dependent enzyme, partial [Chloroflexota bacterium]|nr:aminotransferase class III-fold pyridoxal phosphate-dependent enzyme [Chloroflexota bacterium]